MMIDLDLNYIPGRYMAAADALSQAAVHSIKRDKKAIHEAQVRGTA